MKRVCLIYFYVTSRIELFLFWNFLSFIGFVYIHSNCALFSRQIIYNDNSEFENVIPCVSKSLTRICSHCNRYGASVTCSFNNCDKTYHYPCSAASAGFQHLKTHSFICNTHIDHIPLLRKYTLKYIFRREKINK